MDRAPLDVPVSDEEQWRLATIDWLEAIHAETRRTRVAVQVFVGLFLLGIVVGVIGAIVAASN